MPSGLGNLGGRNSNQRDALKRRKTYKEHSEFLQSFLNYREVGRREREREGEEEGNTDREEKDGMGRARHGWWDGRCHRYLILSMTSCKPGECVSEWTC